MKIRYYEKRPGAWHLDFWHESRRLRPFAGATRQDAERNAAAVIARALAPAPASVAQQAPKAKADGPTFRDAFKLAMRVRESWITSKDKGTLETTFQAIVDTKGDLVREETPMGAFTRDFVRTLRDAWLVEPGKATGTTLSRSTINHRLSMLTVLLEVCDMQPHGVKHLSVKGTRRTRRISDEEYRQMLDWCNQRHGRRGMEGFIRLLTAAWETAARQGELLALSRADVTASTVTLRDTKNGETRTVPLSPAAARVLRPLDGLPAPFSDLTQGQAQALWSDMRVALGLATDTEFVFHALRHERISRWLDEGHSPATVQAIAGHNSITTTMIYKHTSLAAMAAVVNPQQQPRKEAA